MNPMSTKDWVVGLLGLLIILYLYFLPSTIAEKKKHRNRGAIAALNLLLGWTFLGWVAALVWALTNEKQ